MRISWDEAAELVAAELKRVGATYGPEAVLSQADMHGETKHLSPSHGCANRLLSLLGGYTIQMRNLDSWEGQNWGAKHVWGCEPVGEMMPAANLYPDIAEHGELLLFWGCDPETTPHAIQGMMASRLCYWLTEMGLKSIYVCPDLNYGAAVHADKWIPILPNTDAALHLAIAYVWLTEGTYDKEYIATHSYGFDKFEDYVLGKEDGVPKTPAWAAEKCGVPEWTIKALARDWARQGHQHHPRQRRARHPRTLLHRAGPPGSHAAGHAGPGQARRPPGQDDRMVDLAGVVPAPLPGQDQAATRQLRRDGPPGRLYGPDGADARPCTWADDPEMAGAHRAGGQLRRCSPSPNASSTTPSSTRPSAGGGCTRSSSRRRSSSPSTPIPAPGCSEIHMIWTDSPCWITCWNDSNSYIKALQQPSIECIVAQHPWLENDCLMADIILPGTTRFEMLDIGNDLGSGVFTSVFLRGPLHRPGGRIAVRLRHRGQDRREAGAAARSTPGARPWRRSRSSSFEASGVDELVSWEELKEKQYYVIPCDPTVKDAAARAQRVLRRSREQARSPLRPVCSSSPPPRSRSTSPTIPSVRRWPRWIEKGESHDERLSSERAAEYPLLCMSNHPRWRMHAQGDDITWTREIPTMKVKGPDGYLYEPVWLNPAEAAARGIAHGDIVKVFNERGTVLGGAYVTERLMPGVAYMDHGARWDPIIPGKLDRGGAINTITPHNITSKNATGMVVSGFLVEVAKVTDEEMDGWRRDYPEAFARDYDPATGVSLSGWLIDSDRVSSAAQAGAARRTTRRRRPMYTCKYPHLFSPIRLGDTVFRNRLLRRARGLRVPVVQELSPRRDHRLLRAQGDGRRGDGELRLGAVPTASGA